MATPSILPPAMHPDAQSPALQRWRTHFDADPGTALAALLGRRVSLGPYNRARPSDALRQILIATDDLSRADEAWKQWLAAHVDQAAPEGVTAKRWAETLDEGFHAIRLLPLPMARGWCAQHHGRLRVWLRGFYFGTSLDPESALLLALAHGQTDRSLQGLWLQLTRLSGGVDWEYGQLGLLGLRQMPADDQGGVEHGLPPALLRGLLELGEVHTRSSDPKGRLWKRELDFLALVYPMSKLAWTSRFREVLQVRKISRKAQDWLDTRYPGADRAVQRQGSAGLQAPPSARDTKDLIQRIERNPTASRPQIEAFLSRHRAYTELSGDSFGLVRSFCNLGNTLLSLDPTWTRELAHEAARWEPGNPHTWGLLARALEAEGDWRRAQAVYWHARRRFPENAHAHNQLGHALLVHGEPALGEAVYREAMRLFPDDAHSAAELGHSLRTNNQLDAAVQAYRDAQQRFPTNPVIANALTDCLIDLGDLAAAADALTWAEQIGEPGDPKLRQIGDRLRRAHGGAAVQLRHIVPPDESRPGDLDALVDISGEPLTHAVHLGQTTLWRRQGGDALPLARDRLDTLPANAETLIETGLYVAAAEGWATAADWFEAHWHRYPGDGVLRVHRQRALARADRAVDWSLEHQRYPWLLPVILTEERGEPRHLDLDPADPELGTEQRQELWYNQLVGRADPALRDLAQEELLASRHLL